MVNDVTQGELMKESDEQRQLIQYIRNKPWGQFLFHIPNESVGGYGWMIRNRQMGMKKGVPDLMLPIPMHGYHGLFIEMKAKGGRLSQEQKSWLNALDTFGYKTAVCVGWEAAAKELEGYMDEHKD